MTALLLGICVSIPCARAAGQALSLVTEQRGDQVRFWWSDPETVTDPTDLDRVLWQTASDVVIDPRGSSAVAAGISVRYREPNLSLINARNLASFYEARLVVVGEATLTPAEPVIGRIGWVAELRLRYRLAAVEIDLVHVERERLFVGVGDDAASAEAAVWEQAADALIAQLRATLEQASFGELPSTTVPVVMVGGLSNAAPLVAFKGDLRRHSEVVADVREVWATEGRLALEVLLQPGLTMEHLRAVLMELAYQPSEAYSLTIDAEAGLVTDVTLAVPER